MEQKRAAVTMLWGISLPAWIKFLRFLRLELCVPTGSVVCGFGALLQREGGRGSQSGQTFGLPGK